MLRCSMTYYQVRDEKWHTPYLKTVYTYTFFEDIDIDYLSNKPDLQFQRQTHKPHTAWKP